MLGIHRGPAMRREAILGAAVAGAAGLAAVGAWFLPAPDAPVELHSDTVIARAPAEVFDFVASPANWPRWHPSSIAVSGALDHPLQVGEQVIEDYIVAGRRGRATWTVTDSDAPRRWRIDGHSEGGGRAWITYTLTEQAGMTRFERTMLYRMPNLLAAMLDPLLTRDKIAAESAQAVRQLKEVLERKPAPSQPWGSGAVLPDRSKSG